MAWIIMDKEKSVDIREICGQKNIFVETKKMALLLQATPLFCL